MLEPVQSSQTKKSSIEDVPGPTEDRRVVLKSCKIENGKSLNVGSRHT